MTELAEIFCRYGPQYREKYGARMLPSHRRVMRAVQQCRTAALGGLAVAGRRRDKGQRSLTAAG